MTKQITLRQETEEDFNDIFEVNNIAFGQDSEAKLVNALRNNPAVFIPELSIVAIENDKIIGIITDGDIRRMLNDRDSIADLTAKDIMSKNPKLVSSETMAVDALNILEDFSITQLIVSDEGTYKGVLHLHDILKEGIV